jgi:hypothetical protein
VAKPHFIPFPARLDSRPRQKRFSSEIRLVRRYHAKVAEI